MHPASPRFERRRRGLLPPSPHTAASPRHAWLRTALALVIVLALAACDSHDAASGASASLPGPPLATATSDVLIPADGSTRGDFLFHPVDIPPGGTFAVELLSGPSPYTVLAGVLHRGLQDGRTQIEVDVSNVGGLFAVEMRLEDDVQRLDEKLTASSNYVVGTLREEPTSYHYEVIEENGEKIVVVEVDYERTTVGGGGAAHVTPAGTDTPLLCSHVGVRPEQPLDPAVEIAAVRMRGVGTGDIEIVEQHVE